MQDKELGSLLNRLYGKKELTASEICEHIETVNTKALDEVIDCTLAYSLLYSLCELLALHLQEHNLLKASNVS